MRYVPNAQPRGLPAPALFKLVAVAVAALVLGLAGHDRATRSEAAFHIAHLDEAMFGYGGDPSIQYIEVEMVSGGQNVTAHSIFGLFNADGTYFGDILEVPANVPTGFANGHWLVATPGFAAQAGMAPDFTFPVIASPPATGMVCFGGGAGAFPQNPPTWNRLVMSNWVDCIPYGGYASSPNKYVPPSCTAPCSTPLSLGDGSFQSLTRVTDTDNPAADFAYQCPTPQSNGTAVGFNHDNTIDLPPPRTFDDATWPNSDTTGDDCGDTDDDNDGFTDATEMAGAPCGPFTAPTHPRKADTDGDRFLDSAECTLSPPTNPNDPASKPAFIVAPDADSDGLPDGLDPNSASTDTDGDGLRDGIEFRFYGSNPSNANTDGDLCTDGKEVATIDGNNTVNSADLGTVASAFGNSTTPQYHVAFDTDKNGAVGASDLGYVASKFGSCP